VEGVESSLDFAAATAAGVSFFRRACVESAPGRHRRIRLAHKNVIGSAMSTPGARFRARVLARGLTPAPGRRTPRSRFHPRGVPSGTAKKAPHAEPRRPQAWPSASRLQIRRGLLPPGVLPGAAAELGAFPCVQFLGG
jgi:hypothetical protein